MPWAASCSLVSRPGPSAPRSAGSGASSASGFPRRASTERGILVTRLWYLRQVDPRTILYTGLTRDGTFLVEGGRIVAPDRDSVGPRTRVVDAGGQAFSRSLVLMNGRRFVYGGVGGDAFRIQGGGAGNVTPIRKRQ